MVVSLSTEPCPFRKSPLLGHPCLLHKCLHLISHPRLCSLLRAIVQCLLLPECWLGLENNWRIDELARQRSHFPRLFLPFFSSCLSPGPSSNLLLLALAWIHSVFFLLLSCGVELSIQVVCVSNRQHQRGLNRVSRTTATKLQLLLYSNPFHSHLPTVAGLSCGSTTIYSPPREPAPDLAYVLYFVVDIQTILELPGLLSFRLSNHVPTPEYNG